AEPHRLHEHALDVHLAGGPGVERPARHGQQGEGKQARDDQLELVGAFAQAFEGHPARGRLDVRARLRARAGGLGHRRSSPLQGSLARGRGASGRGPSLAMRAAPACASVCCPRQPEAMPMRSAMHHRFGDPAEVLVAGDSPLPEPGPGEVRVRMRLAPIHNHDLWTVRGQYGWKPSLPAIGGSEGFGVVDALGAGVEGFAPGQRVTAASGRGTWAEYFVAPAGMLVPVPDAIGDELAAQLVAMPLSALMLLETLDVAPGQ